MREERRPRPTQSQRMCPPRLDAKQPHLARHFQAPRADLRSEPSPHCVQTRRVRSCGSVSMSPSVSQACQPPPGDKAPGFPSAGNHQTCGKAPPCWADLPASPALGPSRGLCHFWPPWGWRQLTAVYCPHFLYRGLGHPEGHAGRAFSWLYLRSLPAADAHGQF